MFECDITAKQMEKLKQRLKALLKEKEDSLRFYLLCQECAPRIEVVGLGEVEKTKDYYVV